MEPLEKVSEVGLKSFLRPMRGQLKALGGNKKYFVWAEIKPEQLLWKVQ